jgi:3-(3-hydroxy-phenyl)propionate hydroxylase
VQLAVGVELVSFDQDPEGVDAVLRDADGNEHRVRTQYLVGSDGGRSTVREALKLAYEGRTHANKWVVIECGEDPLDAPYTALHCEPRRPYVCLRLPYGLRRWEFMLFPGEDSEQMLAPAKVQELLGNHVADPGRLKVIRARVYTHNSRVAQSFVVGRVCLAGDAAHITPPWIGQGLNAGLRDAFNLAWKLAWIVHGRMAPSLLQSYHDERHAHAKAMIDLADMFGAVLSQRNRALAWIRDRFFLSIRNIPRVRDYVLQMKFKPMPRFSKGVVLNSGNAAQDELIGRMFIQPLVEAGSDGPRRMDDVLGGRFVLLAWRGDPLRSAPAELLAQLDRLGCDRHVGVRARSGAHEVAAATGGSGKMALLQDNENALNAWFVQARVDWVLLRPDRFVAAAGASTDAVAVLERFCAMVLPADVPPAPAPDAACAAERTGATLLP